MKLRRMKWNITMPLCIFLLQALFTAGIPIAMLTALPSNSGQANLIIATNVQVIPAKIAALDVLSTVNLQTTPTVDPTVTALKKERLELENNWLWNYAASLVSTFALIVAGIFGFFRYLADRQREREKQREAEKRVLEDRQDEREKREEEQNRWLEDRRAEREKRTEERFKSVVEGLGDPSPATQVGAAILLRTFIRPGPDNEQFYGQVLDLAVANLRLHTNDLTDPEPLDSLRQALITVFKESFPLARDWLKLPAQSFDATHIRLDNAYLSAADLEEAWMQEAYLRKATLHIANLKFANLRLAKLTGANLSEANLSGADLTGANLSGTDLTGANLSEANLSGADLTGANLSGTDLTGANLSEADLTGTYLHKVNFARANLSKADLSRTSFYETNLTDAVLSWANFKQAQLALINLKSVDLSWANLRQANLSKVNLTEANLTEADLTEADLTEADLARSRLYRASLNKAKFNNANLSGADLSEADLIGFDPAIVNSLKNTLMKDVKGLTEEQLDNCEVKGAIVQSRMH
jgi:uncharacterized protein YjbI with pentapeptide repeats